MKKALRVFAIAAALTGAACFASDTENQPSNLLPGDNGAKLKHRSDDRHPEKAPAETEKARSKMKVDTHSPTGNGKRLSNIDEIAPVRPDHIPVKAKHIGSAPRPNLKKPPVAGGTQHPSVIAFGQPARPAMDSDRIPTFKTAAEHPGPPQIKSADIKATEPSPHFVQSRFTATGSIGGLTSASNKTSAAAINGTGIKYRR